MSQTPINTVARAQSHFEKMGVVQEVERAGGSMIKVVSDVVGIGFGNIHKGADTDPVTHTFNINIMDTHVEMDEYDDVTGIVHMIEVTEVDE